MSKPVENPKKEVYEYFLAKAFGWRLDYIRSLSYKDLDIMTTLAVQDYRITKQLENKGLKDLMSLNRSI